MAKEKITDSRKNEVLTNIGEYIKTKMNPDPSLWFPNKMANATIGFLRYTNVEIEIRVNTHKFNNGNKLSNVDIHVWVKKNDLLQQFRGLEQQFKDKVTEPAECEWSGNNVLVHYHVPIKWERWETLDDANKNKVSDAFMAISEILSDSGIDLGGPMKKSGNKRSVGEVGAFAFRNLIVFGAPGTGKSHYLDSERVKKKKDVIGDSDSDEGCFARYERVTFYPTYSYAQFVGSYKPVMKDVDKDGFELDPANGRTRKAIAYEFVPGPFLRILKDALLNKGKNYLLIIEEINRANAAAVFGDVFQLLDRNDDGKSEYSITSSREMIEYLERKIADDKDGVAKDVATELRIPSNLYIWATMNSADQGVFPLDTAFKRRWDFKYRSLDDNTSNDGVMVEVGDYICKWGVLRKAINELLKRSRVNEDKLLSSSFVGPDIISAGRKVISAERFEMKVLMYLWEDAARMCRQNVFSDDVKVLSDLIKAWTNARFDDVEELDPEAKKTKRGVLRAGLNLGDTKFDFSEKEKPAEDKGQEEDAEPQPPPPEQPAEAPAEAPAAEAPAAEAHAAEGNAGEEEKKAQPAEETDKGPKNGEDPQTKD